MSPFKILKIAFPVFVVVSLLLLAGCDAGSNSPVSTGLPVGDGYKVQLGSSIGERLKVGGSTTLTAVIFEPDGSPIRDGEKVFFASSVKASFSDDTVETSGGTAVVNFTAGDDIGFNTVTATCHGAISSLQIIVTSF